MHCSVDIILHTQKRRTTIGYGTDFVTEFITVRMSSTDPRAAPPRKLSEREREREREAYVKPVGVVFGLGYCMVRL